MKSISSDTEQPRVGARWGQEKRLEFIDFRLRWDGHLNRGDISDFFGVSTPQASIDISRYIDMAPHNVRYNRSERSYVATEKFQPLYPTSHPQKYLSDLLAEAYGILDHGETFLGWRPDVAVVPTPARSLSADTIIALIGAMRRERAVDITYQSISSPAPKRRLISPHAFGHDGHRWHVRAYCHLENAFRDFVISRILALGEEVQAPSKPPIDEEWDSTITLLLGPNPELSEAHQRVIELDYGMEGGEVRFECRRALLLYVMRNLGLDEVDGKSPKVQQIVLKNRSDVEPFLPC